ncbi:MAG TPA: cyclase family protein, partial [Lacipirellulaceae bacterium]|nr:cyclase family protein [Lacipirellulaceae bacterium]
RVFPGDLGIDVTIVDRAAEPTPTTPRRLNCSRVSFTVHNGTHLDAPYHFFDSGLTVEAIPLTHCCGPAATMDLSGICNDGVIDGSHLNGLAEILAGRTMLLVSTGWESSWGDDAYFTHHPVFSRTAAERIVASGVRLLGVDMPSVDRAPFEAHVELLGNGVLIVENLCGLRKLLHGHWDFFAAPLPLCGRDASPVRAFAVKSVTAG